MQTYMDIHPLPKGIEVIGRGHPGGKAKNLIILKRKIQEGVKLTSYDSLIEIPSATVVTTDIFDEFMEINNLNDAVQDKCDGYIDDETLCNAFMSAEFPEDVEQKFIEFLDRKKVPIAVRSSSLLEDNPIHSFAGIYLSLFIPNKGSTEKRLRELENAIKKVYWSTFNPNAKEYRKRHGIYWGEEKMSVILQDMVGSHHGNLYYPLFAGVAYSFNFYPWSSKTKKEDGVVRLVYGLGTKAVGRDFARVFSPSNPFIRPEGNIPEDIIRYSQHHFDALNMDTGELVTLSLSDAIKIDDEIFKVMAILRDDYISEPIGKIRKDDKILPTFDLILKDNRFFPFVPLIKEMLRGLEKMFNMHVDMEFAVNFNKGKGMFYLLQVRSLGAYPHHRKVSVPRVPTEDVIIRGRKVLGNGLIENIKYIVYVSPKNYRIDKAYNVARDVGRMNDVLGGARYILIGPGRWATTHPDLGVPVEYSEISSAAAIVEVATRDLTPELSYGTHFFTDMVSTGVLYIPVFPEKKDYINENFLENSPNQFPSSYVKLIHVERGINVVVDGTKNEGLIYLRQKRKTLKEYN